MERLAKWKVHYSGSSRKSRQNPQSITSSGVAPVDNEAVDVLLAKHPSESAGSRPIATSESSLLASSNGFLEAFFHFKTELRQPRKSSFHFEHFK